MIHAVKFYSAYRFKKIHELILDTLMTGIFEHFIEFLTFKTHFDNRNFKFREIVKLI